MTEIVADSFAGGKLAQYLFATAAMDGVRGLYVTVDSASAGKGPERLPEFSTAWRARIGEYERLFEICGSHRPMDLDLIVVADIAALFPRASYDQERREPYEARVKATRRWMRLCKEDKALRSTAVMVVNDLRQSVGRGPVFRAPMERIIGARAAFRLKITPDTVEGVVTRDPVSGKSVKVARSSSHCIEVFNGRRLLGTCMFKVNHHVSDATEPVEFLEEFENA